MPAGEPVHVAYVPDSGGAEVAERHAALPSAALDREVRLHDRGHVADRAGWAWINIDTSSMS